MLKRTIGRSLLVLLMVTGFAGTIDTSSITSKERKAAVNLMKDTKSRVLNSVKGLSKTQLEFRPAADQWSIQDCIYHIATTEKALWSLFENVMKGPATPEKRSELKMTDEEFVKGMTDRSRKVKTSESMEPQNSGFQSLDAALTDFKQSRTDHIRYIKHSTEDLRNHMTQMPFGLIDCYQLCLMVAAHSERHVLQIEEIKANAAFPKE